MDELASTPEQSQELANQANLVSLAERLNESLRLSGASSAEQAFGIGCTMGLAPILVILLILFILKVINLILVFILLVMGLLVMVGVAMLVAQRARIHHQALPDSIQWEPGGILPGERRKLERMGYALRGRPGFMALINAIRVTPAGLEGVSDPRTVGAAVGF